MQRATRNTACARLGLALAWVSYGTAAFAAAPDAALSWVRGPGAETCISLRELAVRVEARMSGRTFAPAAEAAVNVEGTITREAGAWLSTLAISDAQGRVLGRRTLQSTEEDCRSIDQALVLVIALALDPSQAYVALPGFGGEVDPAETLLHELPSQAAPRAAATSRKPPAVPPPPPQAAESPASSLALGLDLQAALGLVPHVGLGGALFARWMLPDPDWAFEVRAGGFLPREVTAEGGGVIALGVAQVGGGVCTPHLDLSRMWLRPCAGLTLGALTVAPRELNDTRSDARLLPISYFAADLEYRLGSFGVRARAALEIPLKRDRIQVVRSGGGTVNVFRSSAPAGSFGIGFFVLLGA